MRRTGLEQTLVQGLSGNPGQHIMAEIVAAYVRLAFFKLGFYYYCKYLAGIGAVNAAGAGKAVASFLPSNDYVLVVVGKAADIKPLLAQFKTWEEKKITDPDL
jgi:hypothetical protein